MAPHTAAFVSDWEVAQDFIEINVGDISATCKSLNRHGVERRAGLSQLANGGRSPEGHHKKSDHPDTADFAHRL
jgi:hypothetical protein